jgi:hypothetical protein
MRSRTFSHFAELGIERVAVRQSFAVARVDVMTRSRYHASLLEETFKIQPACFAHEGETLHAFPRLPAASARRWLEAQGIDFVVTEGGLRQDGPVTWVQGGFAPGGAAV